MLKIRKLSKTYSSGVRALNDVALDVPPGMFGLLGPNGAGKTTLMKILATLLEPDSGTAEMNGIDLIIDKHGTRKMLGYLPQEFGLYPTLTAEQTLHYFAKLKGVFDKKERGSLVDALLDRVNLAGERKQRVGGFSGGMRQRLGIAQALIGQPQLIIVDEPTAGLDPEERNRFHSLLSETADENALVILSTHIVSDISSLCSQMAVIRQGAIVASIAPQQAIDQLKDSVWEATVPREQVAALKSRYQVISSQMFGGQARVRVTNENYFGSDKRTRLTLLYPNQGETISLITAQAQDAQLRNYALAVEDLRKVPNVPWMSQLIVRLPGELAGVTDVNITVSARGLASNAATIRLK